MKLSSYRRFFHQRLRMHLNKFNNPEAFLYFGVASATVLSILNRHKTEIYRDEVEEYLHLYDKYRKSEWWSKEEYASLLDQVYEDFN